MKNNVRNAIVLLERVAGYYIDNALMGHGGHCNCSRCLELSLAARSIWHIVEDLRFLDRGEWRPEAKKGG